MFNKNRPECQSYPDEREDTTDRCQALIFDKTNLYVLIVKEAASPKYKHLQRWGFPKGHFKVGEKLSQCIHREVCEEVGIKIDDYDHTYETFDNNMIIRIKKFRNYINVQLGSEIQEYTWISTKELKDKVKQDILNKKNNPDYMYTFNAKLRQVVK